MAGRRVKVLTYSCREFNVLFDNAGGGGSNAALSAYLRGNTHVEDASVIEVARDGDNVKVYVESATFPELGCCYKKNAPEWLVVERGER